MNTEQTHHAHARQLQRNIHPDVVELVLNEGMPLSRNSDRLLLNQRRLRQLRREGKVDRRTFERAEKAVPLVCVLADGRLLTVFRVTRSINRGR